MKIIFVVTGKTREAYLREGIMQYEKKIGHFISFECVEIPDLKGNLSPREQSREEGRQILSKIDKSWDVWLLDENGKTFSSEGFAGFFQLQMNKSVKVLCFVAGGPYGFSDEMYEVSKGKIALSTMTFTHQMVRLIFTEQVYRAFTIIKGTGYHHS